MTDRNFDMNTFFETYRSAYAPILQAQQEGFKAFERLVRHQYAVAGDMLEFSLATTRATLGAKSGDDMINAQRELGTDLTTKMQKRAEEFATIATESQQTVNKLFNDATAKAASASKKAA
ncbi:MAG TPA: phasin family protein [Steroidobacteraceae bacterium]|nr:phasin family protein [Steroidobacteraceae bacterium]HRX88641.1 phasin family protein [Steroidobacteraceae bacterium]